jgi:hypothetical protein
MTTARDLAPQIRRQRQGTARYELHGNLTADLSEQLLTLHPPTSSRRFVCYPLSGTGRFADLGRTVELEVFGETFGNDRAEMEQEYGPYEDASRFFVVMDQRRRRPAGVLRVIGNSAVGLKTLRDIAGEPLRISQAEVQARHAVADLDRCWDVGTLAVRPEYRRSATRRRTVSLLLYRALSGARRRCGSDDDISRNGLRPGSSRSASRATQGALDSRRPCSSMAGSGDRPRGTVVA